MRCARGAEYNLYTGGGGGTGGNYDIETQVNCNTLPLSNMGAGAGWAGISGAYTGSDYISGEGGASAWTTGRRDYTPVNTSGIRGNGGGDWNDNLTSGIKSSSGADGLGGYVFVYFGGW